MLKPIYSEFTLYIIPGTIFYRLYKGDCCVYVGQSGNIYERIGEHIRNFDFDKIVCEPVPDVLPKSHEANKIESAKILMYLPLKNKTLSYVKPELIDLGAYCNTKINCPLPFNMVKYVLDFIGIKPEFKNYYERVILDYLFTFDKYHSKSLPLPITYFTTVNNQVGQAYFLKTGELYEHAIITPAPTREVLNNIRWHYN